MLQTFGMVVFAFIVLILLHLALMIIDVFWFLLSEVGASLDLGVNRELANVPPDIERVAGIVLPFEGLEAAGFAQPGNAGVGIKKLEDQDNAGKKIDNGEEGHVENVQDREKVDREQVLEEVEQDQEEEEVDGVQASNPEGNWLTYGELMLDSYPAKSKMIYLKAYKNFERYLKSQKQFVENVVPSEIQVLNYFYFLKNEKHLAPTTLWSTYSRVNACVKRLFGFSLKNYVRVTDVLKSYESGYKVKKASIFTPQEVITN